MGGRSKSRQELGPGPGQYDPSDQLVRSKSPSCRIVGSATVRDTLVNKSIYEIPGPG